MPSRLLARADQFAGPFGVAEADAAGVFDGVRVVVVEEPLPESEPDLESALLHAVMPHEGCCRARGEQGAPVRQVHRASG